MADVSFHEVVVDGIMIRAKGGDAAARHLLPRGRGAERRHDDLDALRAARGAHLGGRCAGARPRRPRRRLCHGDRGALRRGAGAAAWRTGGFWLALFRRPIPPSCASRARGASGRSSPSYPNASTGCCRSPGRAPDRPSPTGGDYAPIVAERDVRATLAAWWLRQRLGKWLNVARLVKAGLHLRRRGAYGLWKLRRHTGVDLPLTRWRERHPILAARA